MFRECRLIRVGFCGRWGLLGLCQGRSLEAEGGARQGVGTGELGYAGTSYHLGTGPRGVWRGLEGISKVALECWSWRFGTTTRQRVFEAVGTAEPHQNTGVKGMVNQGGVGTHAPGTAHSPNSPPPLFPRGCCGSFGWSPARGPAPFAPAERPGVRLGSISPKRSSFSQGIQPKGSMYASLPRLRFL